MDGWTNDASAGGIAASSSAGIFASGAVRPS